MQIVINVPDKLICEVFERPFTEEERNILIKAIGNGVSLDKIRAEIKEQYGGCGLINDGLDMALSIIDKYTAEDEE